MRAGFVSSIKSNEAAFGLKLSRETIERLADYYDLVQEHNPILHLVGPCSAEEFAIRHILESLTLLEHLPANARFADVGAGAGLPSIPCLIVRDDLSAVLIESKEKKARFLEAALSKLDLTERAIVVNKQFEEVKEKDFSYVTSRALDKFTERLPKLLKWTGNRPFAFFAGPSAGEVLIRLNSSFNKKLIARSNQRFLYFGSHAGK
jgi:16S rRNA (guanine527-N7)-methyltransferase